MNIIIQYNFAHIRNFKMA